MGNAFDSGSREARRLKHLENSVIDSPVINAVLPEPVKSTARMIARKPWTSSAARRSLGKSISASGRLASPARP